MKLEEFLDKKRIDAKRLRQERPGLWAAWEKLFERLGPASFDQQKKFDFNPLRLSFPSQKPIEESSPAKPKKKLPLKKPNLKKSSSAPTQEEAGKEPRKAPLPKKKLPLKKVVRKKENTTQDSPPKQEDK